MGHRHLFGTSQMLESSGDQNWNHLHTEQHYANLGENMPVGGVHVASHWNPALSTNGYTISHNVEVPHYQPDALCPSYDPFLHLSNAGAFYRVSENYVHHAAPSNHGRQTFHGIEGGGLVDLSMGNGRGPHKRKSPGVPSVCERGSTSRYYGAGSSSDLLIPSELWQEKPNMDSQHMPWDRVTMAPSYRSNAPSIMSEGSMRNVRSRPALDLESNLAIAHLSINPPHSSCATAHHDHSSSTDHSLPHSSALTREWPHSRIAPAYGRFQVSGGFTHDSNESIVGSTAPNASLGIGAFHQDLILGGNPVVPQIFHGTPNQSVRCVHSSYSQRSGPAFRASSSTMRMGHVGSSDEGMHLVAESFSSRHSRQSSAIAWRHNDRSGRSRMSNERYRSLSDESSLHERFSSEGFLIVDRSSLYGSRTRSMLDQHRDMRLDIDNMTYEELLALGERIGSVSTGLSEDLISKYLTESIYCSADQMQEYCSADQMQEEDNCVICLEEYKNMVDVGTLKSCGHDFHVTCIKKWLSVKNLCPICKASVVADNKKE